MKKDAALLASMLLALAVLAQSRVANAMGDSPFACTNRYDGRITSFTISNGTQTFDVMANPGITINVNVNGYYNTTFTVRTANLSSSGNTNLGTTWYHTDVYNFGQGVCVPNRTNASLGPNQNVILNAQYLTDPRNMGSVGSQSVHWGTWENGRLVSSISYYVNWNSNYPPRPN